MPGSLNAKAAEPRFARTPLDRRSSVAAVGGGAIEARRAATALGFGTRPLLVSFHVTRRYRYGPRRKAERILPQLLVRQIEQRAFGRQASSSARDRRCLRASAASSAALATHRREPCRPDSRRQGRPRSRCSSSWRRRSGLCPPIHSRSGGGGWISRYGTGRPPSVTSRRSVKTVFRVEALAAPERRETARLPARSGASIANRCGPGAGRHDGRS